MGQLMRLESREQIAAGVWAIVVRRDDPTTPVAAGQFLNVLCGTRVTSMVLRRPLSIADVSDDGRLITLIFRVVGAGTTVLSELPVGAEIDCAGPLGHGFDLTAAGDRALLFGGGVGVPPMYLLGRRLAERGVQVQFRLGFRDAADVFWTTGSPTWVRCSSPPTTARSAPVARSPTCRAPTRPGNFLPTQCMHAAPSRCCATSSRALPPIFPPSSRWRSGWPAGWGPATPASFRTPSTLTTSGESATTDPSSMPGR